MKYSDIIENSIASGVCKPSCSWWPRYAFHYTDIRNAVKIIDSGVLYCRERAARMDLMVNDNASEQVLSHTKYDVLNSVSFISGLRLRLSIIMRDISSEGYVSIMNIMQMCLFPYFSFSS